VVTTSKTLTQTLAELRRLGLPRRVVRPVDAHALLLRLVTACKTVGAEPRANGIAVRLAGEDEDGGAIAITCTLHHPSAPTLLTTAEQAVAESLCEGRTLAQIAHLRGVSANTVKSQVRQIFRKLDVDSRVALVRRWCP